MNFEFEKWNKELIRASAKLESDGINPVWWDGFHDMLVNRENNLYSKKSEKVCYYSYNAGMKAAKSLLLHLKKESKYCE